MSSIADGPVGGRRAARARRSILFGSVAIALCVGAALIVWWRSRAEPEPIPTFSVDGLDPLVCRSIERRQQEIGVSPHSGAAWGRLGMIFGAYGMRPQALVAFANAELFEAGGRAGLTSAPSP